jgi:hypothetical protein
MEIVSTFLFVSFCVITYEITNYFISLKEPDFRKYFVQKKHMSLKPIMSIVVPNNVLYLVFIREGLDLVGISNIFIVSLIIGVIESALVYYVLLPKISTNQYLSTLNRFIFNVVIYYRFLQTNIIIGIVAHGYIIYVSSLFRSKYKVLDSYVEPLKSFFTEFVDDKQTRENIFAK